MVVYLDGVRQEDGFAGPTRGNAAVALACLDERQTALELVGLDVAADPVNTDSVATRFEARVGYDFLAVRMLDFTRELVMGQSLHAYYNATALVVVVQDTRVTQGLIRRMDKGAPGEKTPDRVLYYLFSLLFSGDGEYLEDVEEELLDLEGEVVKKQPGDCTARLMDIRRRLLLLKRHYEALYDLLEDLEENLNGFIPRQRLNSFRIHTNRADRLGNMAMSLWDHAAQVREAYQNQLDISLNETMKLFTAIAAIFLPLTLIVGWYGMNLRMPEYENPLGYPLVIAGSVLIVAGLLIYFKRKKWF